MLNALFPLAKPLFYAIDAERAHELALAALEFGLARAAPVYRDERLSVRAFGRDFTNPLGMAAGFDKDAKAPMALLRLGFGFVEVGTVTPRPQLGNPKPRLFRLVPDRAIVNRMGFNNDGHDAVRARLAALTWRKGVIGVNIAANRDSKDRIADYECGVEVFHDLADYLVINISSPNTPGLRDLQTHEAIGELLSRVSVIRERRAKVANDRTPLLVKIAPELDEKQLADIAQSCLSHGVDGMIVANTTTRRPNLRSPHARQTGGLSGAPLFAPSTAMLARLYLITGGKIPLVGVGGIDSAETAFEKIRAGATLIQLYTGLVYEGPGLVGRIIRELAARLKREGFARLADAVGTGARTWSARA
ncbi:MAG: quinone-dependent dihydroorotate dehydrogenase [Hyphomicrobiales bacterium]